MTDLVVDTYCLKCKVQAIKAELLEIEQRFSEAKEEANHLAVQLADLKSLTAKDK